MIALSVRRNGAMSVAAVALCGLVWGAPPARAGEAPARFLRSFGFPANSANGVMADLVVPAGSTTGLGFDIGKVAIGELPVLAPSDEVRGAGRRRPARHFLRASTPGTQIRLLLTGVVDGDGNPVTNTGNRVIIDAVVTPTNAAVTAPPFIVPFNITNGIGYVDTLLPVPAPPGGRVAVQVLGVTLVNPAGDAFAVLGFQLTPPRPDEGTVDPAGDGATDR